MFAPRLARSSRPSPDAAALVPRTGGAPLSSATRSFMEPRFGFDFGRVRIHADAAAHESARALGARAYAIGEDIVFARDAYAPDRPEGRRLLAHELTHVAQARLDPSQGALPRRVPDPTPAPDAGPPEDKFDRIAKEVFGAASYDAYLATLKSTTFFGQGIDNVSDQYVSVLKTVEDSLKKSQPAGYKPPRGESALRRRSKGMHGWGMALDFDVLTNPYVLNEAGESEIDKQTLPAYDHIAQFMLNEPQTVLRKLKGGRAAFGGAVGDVYDALKRESDAMKRYFGMMNDRNAVIAFIAGDYVGIHPDEPSPSPDATMAQMKQDYIALGGADPASGKKAPAPHGMDDPNRTGDRPFAPNSGGGQGDPATGFLNLDKAFVTAMTDAGVAWGAIDIGGTPGDIQHFDLRKIGQGAQVYGKLMAK